MKFLKKINKGLILTLIVLLVLIIYLVGVENQRKADKDIIKKQCEEFISLVDKYIVLPEDMQKLNQEIDKKKEDEYVKEMREKLSEKMYDNSEVVDLQYEFIKNILQNGYLTTQEIRSGYERDITKISSYVFEGNRVTVTFSSKEKEYIKYLDMNNEEKERINSNSTGNNIIILQKVGDEWKVVHSNLQFDYYSGDYYPENVVDGY